MTDEQFKAAMIAELAARGYEDIEVLGACAGIGRGTALATRDGQRVKIRAIVPDNITAYRRRHFRLTEVA